jgi:hypothetical protein
MLQKFGLILGGSLFACSLVISADQKLKSKAIPQKKVSFTKEVMPIFKASCYSCHGRESATAGLNLERAADLLKSSAIKKNHGAKSTLVRRLKGLDGLPQMPQGFKPLAESQILTIEKWIDQGANIDQSNLNHWAYVSPKKPVVPSIKSEWIRNPIDAFILEKQLQQGLVFSPRAPKETQIRRVYLDLIGIPPTPEQVTAFLNDKSPDAYEKVVDQLLKSPHYGERQARIWLDLARYADSNGYEADRIRTAFVYRDWVIDAFNKNMKFDDFTIQQLAGDMLPGASEKISEKIATGFHRNSMFNEEGGVNPEESRYNMIIDRVSTTSTVWMGSTVQCARCHDHKYDPFSQKDFFRMYAIFGNTSYTRQGDYKKTAFERFYEPTLNVLSKEDQLEKQKLLSEAKLLLQNRIDASKVEGDLLESRKFEPLVIHSAVAKSKAKLTVSSNQKITASGENSSKDVYTIVGEATQPFRGIRLEAIADDSGAPGRSGGGNFVLTGFEVRKEGKELLWLNSSADFVQTQFDEFETRFGNVNSGWAISPDTKKSHSMYVDFGAELPVGQYEITLKFESPYGQHNLGNFKLSTSSSSTLLAEAFRNTSALLAPEGVIPATSAPAIYSWLRDLNPLPKHSTSQSLSPANRQALSFLLSSNQASEVFRLRSLVRNARMIERKAQPALVLAETPTDKELKTPVYHRGEFTSPTQPVSAGIPTIFGRLNEKANRLSFAKWLVDKKNPLTARVTVNRIWEQYFGRGFVETVEDFGTQGARPTHQKLLDWLAVEFMDSGWDMKHIHRLISTSATFRQSSVAQTRSVTKDPLNVFISRGPRFRMEAEMIRDSALQISGLLNPKIGGPSVMPYQPEGVWNSPYNGEQWSEMKNEERYRRGLYVFVKRTSMYPSFMALDATSREVCNARRTRTNTPLQALTLLNDKAFFEAAKSLGKKMKSKGIEYGFLAATSRMPSTQEKAILQNSLNSILAKYQKDPAASKKIAETPEDAAWTMVGNIVLNLDEVVTKS